jgi:ubiquitin-like modifier-activating enzyme ATG7
MNTSAKSNVDAPMTLTSKPTALLFDPMKIVFTPSFWIRISEAKLNSWKLSEEPKPFAAYYTLENQSRVMVAEEGQSMDGMIPVTGRIVVLNAKPDFDECDFPAKFRSLALQFVTNEEPVVPLVIAYGDFKKHTFTFVACVPALKLGPSYQVERRLPCEFLFQEHLWDAFSQSVTCDGMVDLGMHHPALSHCLVFRDPSSREQYPGWPLRTLLALHSAPNCDRVPSSVLCFRKSRKSSFVLVLKNQTNSPFTEPESLSSPVLQQVATDVDVLEAPAESSETNAPFALGGKLSIRRVNLSSSLDPTALASSAVALNLRLMRWRAMPELDLDKLAKLKVLILGCGTLGCNVARQCLAWGITNLTLVDSGKVALSNAVRQSLFTLDDVGKSKVECARIALGKLHPDAQKNVHAQEMTIPMPGHTLSISEEAIWLLTQYFAPSPQQCDIVFMLTDSRESRWLPTLLAAVHNRTLINAALGFDSYLVQMHDEKAGCYFCPDIVAPRDSLSRRTIDQQCTVTRPGVSMMASALAVEMAVTETALDLADEDAHHVRHIRGYMDGYTQDAMKTQASKCCTACSEKIKQAYRTGGASWLISVLACPEEIERVSGMTEMLEEHRLRTLTLEQDAADGEDDAEADDFDMPESDDS